MEQSNMAESVVGGSQQGGKNLKWTPAMDNCLIDIMLDLVKNQQYQNGSFKPGTYNEMKRQLHLVEPGCGVKVNPHITSRLKTLKRKVNAVTELRGKSGFAWNDEKKQIEADRSAYNAYVKVRKNCKGLNYNPLPRYDELLLIYGNSSATGTNTRGCNDHVPDEDDLIDVDKEVGDESSIHFEGDDIMEVHEEYEKEVTETEAAQEQEKGQNSIFSKPKNKRRRVVEAEAESMSVGKELLVELKPMMEAFTASLGDALKGETGADQESVHDKLATLRSGIQDELEKLEGLTSVEKMQAALILVDSDPKIELFYRQKAENRELFIKCLLGKF